MYIDGRGLFGEKLDPDLEEGAAAVMQSKRRLTPIGGILTKSCLLSKADLGKRICHCCALIQYHPYNNSSYLNEFMPSLSAEEDLV